MNQNILIIFKEKKEGSVFDFYLERKFSKNYNVNIFYLDQHFFLTTKNLIKKINNKIKFSNIDIVLFEGDHVSIIDTNFVNQIDKNVKKGLISFDDNYYHFENLILSTSMDFTLVTDEYLKFQFKEIGVESHICLIEDDKSIFKNHKNEKKYDVLFFGKNKTDRKEIYNFLIENNIKVKTISKNEKAYHDHFELAKIINQSKIVICPTKTETTKRKNNPLYNFNYTYQIKGRVFMVGLSYSLAISEPFPAQNFIFKNQELPIFKTKEECVEIIHKYLSNNADLINDTAKFSKAVELYVEKNSISQIKFFIDNIDKNKNKPKIKVPSWYYLLFFKKNLMLRYRYGFPKSLLLTYFDFLVSSKSKYSFIFIILFPLVLFLFILAFFKNKKPKN